MESASRDCVTCLDTDEVTVKNAHKKYRKRGEASCSLDKENLWSEVQLKWISNSHQALWAHDKEVIGTEWDHALEEEHNFFEIHKMMLRMDQLPHIAEATNSKVYTNESEAEAHGWEKTLTIVIKTIPHPLLLVI